MSIGFFAQIESYLIGLFRELLGSRKRFNFLRIIFKGGLLYAKSPRYPDTTYPQKVQPRQSSCKFYECYVGNLSRGSEAADWRNLLLTVVDAVYWIPFQIYFRRVIILI